jgi:hypothetical protein
MANIKSDIASAEIMKRHERGNISVQDAVVTLGTGSLTVANTLQLCKVSTDSKLVDVVISSPDWGTTGDAHIGFYAVNADNSLGAAVDVDALAADLDMNAAATVDKSVRFVAKARSTANNKVYQLAGLSSAPKFRELWLVITVAEAGTITDGEIHVRVTTSG